MVGVGQSFGGQALGICADPMRFERYCMVASLSGYHRGTDTPWRNLIMMNLLGVPTNGHPRQNGALDGPGREHTWHRIP